MDIKKKIEELTKQAQVFLEERGKLTARLNDVNSELLRLDGAVRELKALDKEKKK